MDFDGMETCKYCQRLLTGWSNTRYADKPHIFTWKKN